MDQVGEAGGQKEVKAMVHGEKMRTELGLELGCWGREAEHEFTGGKVWVDGILAEGTTCRKAWGCAQRWHMAQDGGIWGLKQEKWERDWKCRSVEDGAGL